MVWDKAKILITANSTTSEPARGVYGFTITPPTGGQIAFMADGKVEGNTVRFTGAHAEGVGGIGKNSVGCSNLRVVAEAFMERIGCDELIIEGATRQSGAGPGRTPSPLRFTLRPPPDSTSESGEG
jgi:hypothetical protein